MQAISCSIVVLSGALILSSATIAGLNPISFVVGLFVLIVGLYGWALTCCRPSK